MSNQPWKYLVKFLLWKSVNQDVGYSSNCRYADILQKIIKVRLVYVDNRRKK